ncbi:hypothetical protein FJY71_03885, partial [candidate division WOR-3 bacterium]|nr:hypothetical protein [candidate division WOR-3 bacterium]
MRSRLACVVVLALTATAAGQWIDRTIWTPDSMHGIYEYDVLLHNPVTNRAYFGRRHGDPLQIYDASTRTKFVTHRNLYGARSIVHAPGQHRIYIGFAELGIAALDDRADTLVHFLELPIEQVPFARYNSRDSQLYVGSDHYGIIYSVSCGPDTALWQSTAVEEPVAMEYDSTHNRLYVLEQEQTDSMLAVLDCANGSLVACLPGTSPGNAAHDLALNTSLGKLYVLTEQGPRGALRLAVYDTDSLSLLGDVPLPPEWNFEPIGLWLNPVSNFLYVSLANQGVDDGGESLAVVDCRTDSLCGFVCLPRSYGIQALGLDPDRNRVYVCPCADDSVAVLGVPDSITGWIRTGPAASGALYNPASDEVYFPCENDTLYVVDAEADTVKRVVDYSLLTHYSLFYSAAGPKLYSGTHSGLAAIGPADSLLRWTGFPEVVLGCELLYWPELNRLYVPRCDEPVYVYDCNLDAVVDSITLPFDVRLGLAVPEARTLLLPALAGDSIAVVDLFSNHVTGYAAAHAERLGFNPANNTVVAVDEGFSGCVTSVDPSGGSLVARSPSYLLWSAAVNTRDNEVYVTSEHATPLLHVLDGDSLDEVRQIVM